MVNKTKINAEPGKQEIFMVRELDAPRELVSKHLLIQNSIHNGLGPED